MEPPYVAMIIPDGSNQYFSRLAQLVQRELSRASAGMLLFDSDSSASNERSYIQWIAEQRRKGSVQAVVYIPSGDNFENFKGLFQLDLPVVILDREVPEDLSRNQIDHVLADNSFGMKLVVDHLIELGVMHVVYLAGATKTEPGRARNAAFKQYWEEVPEPRSSHVAFAGDFSFESGRRAGQAILALQQQPDAVVAANDLMALGIMQSLQRSGRRVPDDVIIIGYDDIPLANWVYPTLTTVRQDVEEMARIAAGHVMRRVSGEGNQGAIRTPIEPELVRRESSRRG